MIPRAVLILEFTYGVRSSQSTWAPSTQDTAQGVTNRCRLFWLTNSASALVYVPNCGGRGLWGLSHLVQLYTEAKINFGDPAPYLTYDTANKKTFPYLSGKYVDAIGQPNHSLVIPGNDEGEVGLDQRGGRMVPQVRDQAQHLRKFSKMRKQILNVVVNRRFLIVNFSADSGDNE